MRIAVLRHWCMVLSGLTVAAGVLGMPISFLYLASADPRDISAGTSGFIAGAVLIGSGLISLAILSTRESREAAAHLPPDEPTTTSKDEWRITR